MTQHITVGGAPEGFDARLILEEVEKSGGPVLHVARDDKRLAALQAGDRAAFDTRAAQVSFGAQVQLALAASTLLGPDTPPDQRRLAALALHPAVAPAIAP